MPQEVSRYIIQRGLRSADAFALRCGVCHTRPHTRPNHVMVDGSKHLMGLVVTHSRDDDNNIGDDWDYRTEINGEYTSSTIGISAGESLNFYVEFTENDDRPDIGKASTVYNVNDEDLINGFTVSMELSVRENGGKNSGKAAHFVVTFTFTPANK